MDEMEIVGEEARRQRRFVVLSSLPSTAGRSRLRAKQTGWRSGSLGAMTADRSFVDAVFDGYTRRCRVVKGWMLCI